VVFGLLPIIRENGLRHALFSHAVDILSLNPTWGMDECLLFPFLFLFVGGEFVMQ
jgi:hypothetical protein